MAKTNNNEFNINDYKDQIDKYIKERVEKEAASNSVKLYKKRLRNKSVVIFIELVIIIALVCSGLFSVYYLYKDGYFQNKFNIINKSSEEKPISNNEENKEENKPSLDELINKYSYLLDNYSLNTKCDYLQDFYAGKLTTELKEYFAYQLIDSKYINIEDNTSYFDSDYLEKAYKLLFTGNLDFKSFKYNSASYKYIKEMFVSTSLPINSEKILKEIINIEEKDDNIIITTTEGYIKDNKLYNIISNKEIYEYKKDEKISKYSKKLNIVKYTFNNNVLVDIK